MNDRELLEAAAKAAGMQHKWAMGGLYVDARAGIWNPLTDDGDALRLAVKLRMAMDIEEYSLVAFCGQGLDSKIAHDPIDGDPYAATRRSIVRAAAAMGKQP